MKALFKQVVSFGIIGVLNTIIGTAIMFGCYNLLGLNYWISSAANYFFGSLFSYFMNKRFTFKVKENDPRYVIRFALNITVCYLLAYGIAKRAVTMLLQSRGIADNVIDNIAMLTGMVLFVGFNFIGQKLFVFRDQHPDQNEESFPE